MKPGEPCPSQTQARARVQIPIRKSEKPFAKIFLNSLRRFYQISANQSPSYTQWTTAVVRFICGYHCRLMPSTEHQPRGIGLPRDSSSPPHFGPGAQSCGFKFYLQRERHSCLSGQPQRNARFKRLSSSSVLQVACRPHAGARFFCKEIGKDIRIDWGLNSGPLA